MEEEPSLAADVSSTAGRSSTDISRIKIRVPHDIDEVDQALGTIPAHLMIPRDVEHEIGKKLLKPFYEQAARNKDRYLAAYPGNDCARDVPKGSSGPQSKLDLTDGELSAFDSFCETVPGVLRAYDKAYGEINCDESKGSVEQSKAEYKRLSELMTECGVPPPRVGDINLRTGVFPKPVSPETLEDWTESETAWAEFRRKVEREVSIVKKINGNERKTRAAKGRKRVFWLDQFVGAVEQETGVPFDPEFAEHMADLAAGKDSDISVHAHVRSLEDDDDEDDEWESDSEHDDESMECESVSTLMDDGPLDERRAEAETAAKAPPETPVEPEVGPKRSQDVDSSSDEPFSLESELRRYVALKTRLLLSAIHDSGNIQWTEDQNKTSKIKVEFYQPRYSNWDFGPKELIVLRFENGKTTRTDIVVERDEEIFEKIAVVEKKPVIKKFKSISDAEFRDRVNSFIPGEYLETKAKTDRNSRSAWDYALKPSPNCLPGCSDDHHFFDRIIPSEGMTGVTEVIQEQLANPRKTFRWERYRFREGEEEELTFSDSEPIDGGRPEDPNPECADAASIEETPMTRAARRKEIADGLFQDDSRKYLEYVDPSEMTGLELHRPLPVLTSSFLARGYVPEVTPVPESSQSVAASTDPPVTDAPASGTAPTPAESSGRKNEKTSSKKDKKKKKKRRSSSSSDDLETLEKKSEARLGLRK